MFYRLSYNRIYFFLLYFKGFEPLQEGLKVISFTFKLRSLYIDLLIFDK